MTVNVNIHEARLLERVANGERVVISRAAQPVADLVPRRPTPVVLGGMRGESRYDDDSCTELDPDIQRVFYGHPRAPS